MTTELQHLTFLYLKKTQNKTPSNREVDDYILYSIQYFGSEAEYTKILRWYFKLHPTTQQSK